MENLWYSGIQDLLKEVGLAGRLGDKGGDKGPGPDEPPRRQREIDWDRVFRLMFDVLRRPEPAPSPPSFGPGPILLAQLPPVDIEQGPLPPLPSLERIDREKLLKKMERSIAEEFRRRVLEGQGPVADVDVRELLGRRSPPPTLRLERQGPKRPEEATFSQKFARHMEEEPAREETFTEKLERYLLEPPDFRTPGEKRTDARREAARRKPQRQQPSTMERLLAQLEAERKKGSKAGAPSSRKIKGDERFDEAVELAKKLRKIEEQVAKGDAEPEELWRALAELPPWMAVVSESLRLKQAKAMEHLGLPPEEVATEADSILKPPERLWKVPKSVSELSDIEGRFFERAHEIGDPDQLATEFLNTLGEQYRSASTKAEEFAEKLKKEGIVGMNVKDDDVENAIRHFLGAYTVTREFGSPEMTWTLGFLNELIVSPAMAWWKGESQEMLERDTEIDHYHNQLGIEEAVKSQGKEVPLYELVRRLAKEGKFRY